MRGCPSCCWPRMPWVPPTHLPDFSTTASSFACLCPSRTIHVSGGGCQNRRSRSQRPRKRIYPVTCPVQSRDQCPHHAFPLGDLNCPPQPGRCPDVCWALAQPRSRAWGLACPQGAGTRGRLYTRTSVAPELGGHPPPLGLSQVRPKGPCPGPPWPLGPENQAPRWGCWSPRQSHRSPLWGGRRSVDSPEEP